MTTTISASTLLDRQVLDALRSTDAYAPTLDQLAAETGLARGTVHNALLRLREASEVTWEPSRRGTLRVTEVRPVTIDVRALCRQWDDDYNRQLS